VTTSRFLAVHNIALKLCSMCSGEFKDYLEYARNLEFTEEPDYRALRGLFTDLFRRKGYEENWIFDWMVCTKYKAWLVVQMFNLV